MRRLLRAWVLAVALLTLLLPCPSLTDAQSGPGPEVGDEVPFISESGSEIATLQAIDVMLEWEGYSQYYAPSPGRQYVVIVVEVTNLGTRGTLVIRADDFRLQDADGFLYSRSWADADPDARPDIIPSDTEVGVAPGGGEEVVLVYEVLEGVPLSHLFWQPEFERLITIANLEDYVPGEA